MSKLIFSTGNAEKDAKLLKDLAKGETLVNTNTFEEAREKERRANESTARQPGEPGASRNALTEQPHIEGQLLAVVASDPDDEILIEKKSVSDSERKVEFVPSAFEQVK